MHFIGATKPAAMQCTGMCTFEEQVKGRSVIVHCDNRGSELALSRGRARSWDHAQLVHTQWLHAARMKMELFVRRVSTDDNIADLPSRKVRNNVVCNVTVHPCETRQEFKLLPMRGAIEVPPVLNDQLGQECAWAELQERWS